MPGTLFVIATPLGHLDDLSPRAQSTLAAVDCIACEDTRRTSKLLARFSIDRPLVSCHKFNEKARLEPLLARLAAGKDVALVSDAGTPGVADPGALLVREAIEAGFTVSPIPGPSAVVALLSVSGLADSRFVFEGFLPHRGGERRKRLRELAAEARPIVCYEAPTRILESLRDIQDVLGARRIALGRELTKIHETVLHGTSSQLRSALGPAPRGEFVFAISPGAPGANTDHDATRVKTAWHEELELAAGDRRRALKACARRLGIKRAELYRRLAELDEALER